MKKKKYANGTGKSGVVKNYIKSPSKAIAENRIDVAEAQYEGNTDPFVIGTEAVGQMLMQYGASQGGFNNIEGMGKNGTGDLANTGLMALAQFALGGTTQPGQMEEIEGGEELDMPDGSSQSAKGPKHEQGGIPIDLPPGTKIFSDRIERDGKTMAERELKRDKELAKLKELLDRNPDKLIKNTLQRKQEKFMKEEQEDLAIQEKIAKHQQAQQEDTKEYALGTGEAGIVDDPAAGLAGLLANAMSQMGMNKEQAPEIPDFSGNGSSDDWHTGDTSVDYKTSETSLPTSGDVSMEMSDVGDFESNDPSLSTNDHNMTAGDMTGIVGNMISTFGPLMNTLNSRATDTPNENHMEGFGEDAINQNEKSKDYVNEQLQSALDRVNKQAQGSKRSGRVGARGISQQRAMDLAVDQNANQADAQIYDNFAKQMMQLFSQGARLENIQDAETMRGEERRDLRDRADKDAHYSNMAQNIVGMGEGVQQTGKDLNQTKQNEIIMKMLNQLHKYGVGFDKDYKLTNKQ